MGSLGCTIGETSYSFSKEPTQKQHSTCLVIWSVNLMVQTQIQIHG